MIYKVKYKHNYIDFLIDEEDFDLVNSYQWAVNESMYAVGYKKTDGCRSKRVLMHRLILNESNPLVLCDHADRNRRNNQKSNLRFCNRSQNNRNRASSKSAKSKYLGVSFVRNRSGRYSIIARISINDKDKYLGAFKTEEDAALAYDRAATEVAGEFANLNFNPRKQPTNP